MTTLDLTTDVLVVGGGPAATWAALKAAQAGADVVLADKGYCGTSGAAGYRRQGEEPYRVRAGAVVLATGGCAFLSGALGCNVNTGDGALFAAEAGAELSGMEFSNAYGIAPEHTSVTKTAFYTFATF